MLLVESLWLLLVNPVAVLIKPVVAAGTTVVAAGDSNLWLRLKLIACACAVMNFVLWWLLLWVNGVAPV